MPQAASPPSVQNSGMAGGPRDLRDTPGNRAAAAQCFEALLVGEMLGAMREAKLGDGLLDGGNGQTWQPLRDRLLAESFAGAAPLGLARQLENGL